MELKQQLVDLELAKELHKLGVPQTSIYGWYCFDNGRHVEPPHIVRVANEENAEMKTEKSIIYSAYSVAELGELLPNEREDKYAFFSGLAINGWFCEVKNYRVMPYERLHVELQCETEAEARAKMLIYLLKNNFINA